jgi:hypothetical protein
MQRGLIAPPAWLGPDPATPAEIDRGRPLGPPADGEVKAQDGA